MPTKPTHTERASWQYAYQHIETNAPGTLDAIEKDLRAGLTPAQLESIWRRKTGQDQMAKMVGLAAMYVTEADEPKR